MRRVRLPTYPEPSFHNHLSLGVDRDEYEPAPSHLGRGGLTVPDLGRLPHMLAPSDRSTPPVLGITSRPWEARSLLIRRDRARVRSARPAERRRENGHGFSEGSDEDSFHVLRVPSLGRGRRARRPRLGDLSSGSFDNLFTTL